jgi:hypothetical protein
MSNGHIARAQVEALLVGVPEDEVPRMRYLLTGIAGLKDGLEEVRGEVQAMRKTCEERGQLCPAMHGNIADPIDIAQDVREEAAAVAAQLRSETRQVACDLKIATEQTAKLLREREDKRVIGGFLTRAGRSLVAVCLLVAVAALAYTFFGEGAADTSEITVLVSLVVPFALLYLASKSPRRAHKE